MNPSRRKPKIVIGDGEGQNGQDGGNEDSAPVVRRPAALRNKSKKRTTALSFGGGTSMLDEDDDQEPSAVFVPKKPANARKTALHRSAAHLSSRDVARGGDDQPTYSKDYLAELKQATPSAPVPSGDDTGDDSVGDVEQRKPKKEVDVAAKFGAPKSSSQALDVAAKFSGSSLAAYESSAASRIPSHIEIAAKKAQRARLAAEQAAKGSGSSSDDDEGHPQDHDAMDSDDEFANQKDVISFQAAGSNRKSKTEGRLLQADEQDDFMEDDRAYPNSGKISLKPQSEKAQRAAQREEIRAAIEGPAAGDLSGDDSGTSDSSQDARDAYERAQTRRGLGQYGVERREQQEEEDWVRGRIVPNLPPLPTLANCREKIMQRLEKVRQDYAADVARIEEIQSERIRIAKEEEGVNQVLEETKAKWDRLMQNGVLKIAWDSEKIAKDGLAGDSAGSREDTMEVS